MGVLLYYNIKCHISWYQVVKLYVYLQEVTLFLVYPFFPYIAFSKICAKYCFESQKQASVYHYCTSVWPICSLRSAISGLQSKPSKQDCALSIGLLR